MSQIQIVWTATALANLRVIRAYIRQFNPTAAAEVGKSLADAANNLVHFPHRGRPVEGTSMRELVTSYPYIIRYRVTGDRVVDPANPAHVAASDQTVTNHSIDMTRVWREP